MVRVLILVAIFANVVAQDGCARDDEACLSQESDDPALLHAKINVHFANGSLQVPCPGSGNMCAGNQCCPPSPGVSNKTFPCPSADVCFKLSGCETGMTYAPIAAHVPCPGSGNMCAGNQCCPPSPGESDLTFPCPSADVCFKITGCETGVTMPAPNGSDITALLAPAPNGSLHVPCPGSGNMCAGNQCCPSSPGVSDKTFPCPSADAEFKITGCETGITAALVAPAPNGSLHVPCPGSGNMCAGNQCCPSSPGVSDKTFPCPSADAEFKVTGCETGITA